MASQTITANGTYTFNLSRKRNSQTYMHTVTLAGDFGGGTATFFKKQNGVAVAIKDGPLESATDVSATDDISFDTTIVPLGSQGETSIQMVLSGATNPDLIGDVASA